MKKLFFGILLLSSICLCLAETIIPPGEIYGEWDINGSPYVITGDVNIPTVQSLLIIPGVQVLFQGNYEIIVNGLLIAEGTQEDTIIFSRYQPDPVYNGKGIYISPSAGASTILKYCLIEWMEGRGAGGGIYIQTADPEISNCMIRNNIALSTGGAIACHASANAMIINNIIGSSG